MIVVAFEKGTGKLVDRLIRWWTNGPYCHVELVSSSLQDPYDRRGVDLLSASPRGGGVCEERLRLEPRKWDVIEMPGETEVAAKFIRGQAGLKYDWVGLFCTMIFPFGWEAPNRWFCSEIVAAALGISNPARLSPNALYRLLSLQYSATPVGREPAATHWPCSSSPRKTSPWTCRS